MSGAEYIRKSLATEGEILVCPGVYDCLSTRIAIAAGAKCLYMTGAGTTASKLGQPDLGIATQNDFVEVGTMMTGIANSIPLICDADTGFGGALNVARTMKRYEQAGISALHIEDQVITKRCGHLLGKAVVSRDEFNMRIRAAANGRSNKPSRPVIIARTDTIQTHGVDEAIARLCEVYQCGAEVGFAEGIRTEADARRIIKEVAPMPMLLNMITNGVTPNWTVAQAKEFGFKITIFPFSGISPVVHALRESYRQVIEDGSDAKACSGLAPRDIFEVVGLSEAMELDKASGSTLFGGI